MIPDILRNLSIHWQGVDDSTPAGCTLVCAEIVGLATTYVLRDGQIIGRVESAGSSQNGYIGSGLKGGGFIGSGPFYELVSRIATGQS